MAVHQPNFFPWLGFFDKMSRCDTFVILDDVQFPKGDGNYTNRVQIMNGDGPRWFTVPVDRSYAGVRKIREIRMREIAHWPEKFMRTLHTNYGRCPFFQEVLAWVEPFVCTDDDHIANLNTGVIHDLHKRLGLGCGIRQSSELDIETNSTQRLVDIVRAVGGKSYLTGGGASGYQDDSLFAAAGIHVVMQEFHHPVYPQPQTRTFHPGLSILDALFNLGFDGTARLLGGTMQ